MHVTPVLLFLLILRVASARIPPLVRLPHAFDPPTHPAAQMCDEFLQVAVDATGDAAESGLLGSALVDMGITNTRQLLWGRGVRLWRGRWMRVS